MVSRPGGSVISRPGNSVVSRPGNSIVNRPGDSVVSRPGNSVVSVKARRAAPPKPPACATISTVAANLSIVITVWSAEHHPVGSPTCIQCIIQCISGVTAVAGHRQTIPLAKNSIVNYRKNTIVLSLKYTSVKVL